MPGSYTPNYNLYLPLVKETGWGVLINANWTLVDSILAAKYGPGGADVAVADGGTGLSAWTVDGILYASGITTLAQIAKVNNAVLVTNAQGTPILVLDLPTAITIGLAYIYRAGGNDVPVADGGTGASDAPTARTNLGLGQIAVENTPLAVAKGGTGLSSTPSNGQLPIGNGSGFSLAALIAGLGIAITNGAGSITIKSAITPIALTPGATVDTDASLGVTFAFTANQNFTLANPTNPTDGQKVIWRIRQDATGNRVMTLGTKFRLGTDIISAVLSTTANKTDYLGAIYNLADDRWDVVALVRGF